MTTMPIATANTMNSKAMTTTTQTAQPYWKSVKFCLAHPDGSAEIHHQDGRVERIRPDGRVTRNEVRDENAGKTHPAKSWLRTVASLALASLALSSVATGLAQDVPLQAPKNGLGCALIDDQSGVELAEKHGIKALEAADLDGLINATVQGKTEMRLIHLAVDDDASDNPVATMTFRPFAGGPPPTAPKGNLPVRQLAEEMKSYRLKRAQWQQGIIAYRVQIVGEVEGFVRQVAVTQTSVSERFDRILAERNGRDFNRSDIVGSIEMANKLLKDSARPVLVLNTDGVDLPGKRKFQNAPLSVEQLDPKVMLIFVNTSRLPQQGALFRGLRNEVRHAGNMRQALDMVAARLDQPESEPNPVTP